MSIEQCCGNCENSMISNALERINKCSVCYSKAFYDGFEPRNDLVDLHGKLRKAVKALRKIKDSDAGCEILWQAKDTDGSYYDVHVDDYVDEVLEELQ